MVKRIFVPSKILKVFTRRRRGRKGAVQKEEKGHIHENIVYTIVGKKTLLTLDLTDNRQINRRKNNFPTYAYRVYSVMVYIPNKYKSVGGRDGQGSVGKYEGLCFLFSFLFFMLIDE